MATGYLTGVVDYRVRVWDIAAAYALCLGAGLELKFFGESPFPLSEFHPQAPACPYCVGTASFHTELEATLRGL